MAKPEGVSIHSSNSTDHQYMNEYVTYMIALRPFIYEQYSRVP
jgi:hypothetical protein